MKQVDVPLQSGKKNKKPEGFTVWGSVMSRKAFFFPPLSFLFYSPLLPGAGANLPICLQGQTLPRAPVPQPPVDSRNDKGVQMQARMVKWNLIE